MRSYKNGPNRFVDFEGASLVGGQLPWAGVAVTGSASGGARFSLALDANPGGFSIDGNGDIQVPRVGVYRVKWDGSYSSASTDSEAELAGLIEVFSDPDAIALASQWIATRPGSDAASIVNAGALGWAAISAPSTQKLRVRQNGGIAVACVYSRLVVEYAGP